MHYQLVVYLMVGIFSAVPAWRHRYWEIPGRFCAAQFPALQCCAGRGDHCGAAILNCYSFCERADSADCCPDCFRS